MRIHDGVAGDAKEPGAEGSRAPPVARQRIQGPQEDLLREVRGVLLAAGVRSRIAVDTRDIAAIEAVEGARVGLRGGDQRRLRLIVQHSASLRRA